MILTSLLFLKKLMFCKIPKNTDEMGDFLITTKSCL